MQLFHDEYYDPEESTEENCYTWHPATILLEIRTDFGIELPRGNFDRLMAGIHIITADAFYKSRTDLRGAVQRALGRALRSGHLGPGRRARMRWGITEAMILSPPDADDEEPFSHEIRAYIGKALDEEGILDPPDVLRIAIRDGGSSQANRISQFDDPEIHAAITRTEAAKVGEISDRIKSNLRMLIGQLEALPLAHGDARALAGKLAHTLGME